MDAATLLPLSIAVLLYALVSKRAIGAIVSAPLAFSGFGLLLGDLGLGWIAIEVSSSSLNALAEITLVLALFCDAASIDIRRLNREHVLPVRLLGIGLPLTILLGLALAMLVLPELSLVEAALVAIVLAPTDAALGQPVVSNGVVPERIRRSLNVESGLNDGMVFPVLLMVASLGVVEVGADTEHSLAGWVGIAIAQLLLGPLAGLATGWAGARLVNHSIEHRWVSPAFLRLSTLALPTTAYGAAELTGGNGFLAAFVCGLTVGSLSPALRSGIEDFTEAEGQLLSLIVFFALGAVLLPTVLPLVQGHHVVYALLSLSLIRLLPVALSLRGLGLDRPTVLFVGWFGPRGLASVIYLLILTDDYSLDAIDQIGAVVLLTVAFSVVLHGLSAAPLAARYGQYRIRKSSEK